MLQICHNCFSEYEGVGLCPYCGFNAAEEKRQPLALPGGTILGGRYIVGRVLGQGGFGITYAAQDYNSKAMVAIKEHFPTAIVTRTGKSTVSIIDEKMRESFEEGKEKFLAEAKTLSQFNGLDNICDIYSYFEENGTAYFAMEYVRGIPLDEYITGLGRLLSFEEAVKLLLPAMEALSRVHEKGIIHRDIAPDNIMVTENGDVMLIDFGAARYSMGEKSRSLDVILKHGFAPKEQYARHSRQGAYTDVYAMAATLYYAITGNVPPDAIERTDIDELIPPSRLGIKIPRKAEAALMKALAVNYIQRWQTMGEFSAALKKELSPDRAAPEARRKAEVQRSGKAAKSERPKKKKPVALIAALAALAIGAGAFFGVGGDKAESPVLSESEAPVFTETPVATEIPAPTEEPDYMEWNLDENGTLFIRGKGAMPDYMNTDDLPWAQEHGEGKIKALVIERGITHVGALTAGGCWTLEKLSIADTVISIGGGAFMGCENLRSAIIPGSVTRIMGQAFEHSDYVIIDFKGTEEQWKKVNIIPQGNELLRTSAVVYRYVDGGYAGEKVRWGIDSNGALTFSGEGEMYDYTPGNTPWYHIRNEITQIQSVVIEKGVTKIGEAAFNKSVELSRVTIADSVRSIGSFAFNDCPSLTSLVIPEGVASIGDFAFCSCDRLESITIPGSVTSIGGNAFNACPQLSIEYEGSKEQWDSLNASGNKNQNKVNVNCKYLAAGECGLNAKWNLDKDGTITISGSGPIDDFKRGETPWHKHIETITSLNISEGITSIGECNFYGLSELENVRISDTVKYIGREAFSTCISLKELNIPHGVTKIGIRAFSNCHKLSEIVMPNSLTDIDAEAFVHCYELRDVSLPESVKNIGKAAFSYCRTLTSVSIPISVEKISGELFNDDYELETIYYYGTAEQWREIYPYKLGNVSVHFHG